MGLGMQELVIILIILVLLFGAKKLPELAQGLGKGIREFKKATKDEIDDNSTSKIEDKSADTKSE